VVHVVYDGIHTLLCQLGGETSKNLDCLGHLLGIILTFSRWENFAEESGFELNKAVFNHFLARLGAAFLNGHDCLV